MTMTMTVTTKKLIRALNPNREADEPFVWIWNSSNVAAEAWAAVHRNVLNLTHPITIIRNEIIIDVKVKTNIPR